MDRCFISDQFKFKSSLKLSHYKYEPGKKPKKSKKCTREDTSEDKILWFPKFGMKLG